WSLFFIPGHRIVFYMVRWWRYRRQAFGTYEPRFNAGTNMLPLREAWTSQIHSRQWRIIGPGFFFPLSPLGFTFCVSMCSEREGLETGRTPHPRLEGSR